MLNKLERLNVLQAHGELGDKILNKRTGGDFADLRRALKFTQKEVAKACHVNTATVLKYENGKSVRDSIVVSLWYVLIGVAIISGGQPREIVEALLYE